MRKLSAIFLVLVMAVGMIGCSGVGDIAGNVADAAKQELENQVKSILEKNKVEVVETKTAFGKLNDEGGQLQFFCAVLVKAESDTIVQGCVKALDAVFEEAGMAVQTASKVESSYLVYKGVTFDHSDYSDGTYYVIYGYTSSLVGNSSATDGE